MGEILIAYFFFAYKKVNISIPKDFRKLLIFTILCTGFLWRITLAAWITGHPYDLSAFQNWANTWLIYCKGKDTIFAAVTALLLIAGVFTFSTRMHERYSLGLLAFVYLKDKRFLLLTAGFSLTMYADTHYVLFETLKGINSDPFDPVLFLTSLFNVLLFGYLLKLIYSIMLRKKHYSADRVQHKIMD